MSLVRSPSFASLFSSSKTAPAFRVASPEQQQESLQYSNQSLTMVPSNLAHQDGPTNVTTNLQHLRIDTKEQRRGQYEQFVDSHKQLITAAGTVLPFSLKLSRTNLFHRQVNKWLRDGQVSVATHPCTQCVEMNSARPQHQPAMSCLVRSKFKMDNVDGSGACAVCYAMGKFQCSSRAVVRRTSLDSKMKTFSSILQVDNFLAPKVLTRPDSCELRSSTRTDSCELMNSENYIHGDVSASELIMKKPRFAGKSPAFLSTGEELHESDAISFNHCRGSGLSRTLTDGSKRRAKFNLESGLGDQFEALELLTSQVEGLQKNYNGVNEKIEKMESILESNTLTLKAIQQKTEDESLVINKLQANSTDQTNSNFHLAKLIEVVDDLQRSIVLQKVDIQALKQQESPLLSPRANMMPRTESLSDSSQTLDDLRRFIHDTEDKQRQRKALYLEHLNRELQRTMQSDSMSRRSGLMSRTLDI